MTWIGTERWPQRASGIAVGLTVALALAGCGGGGGGGGSSPTSGGGGGGGGGNTAETLIAAAPGSNSGTVTSVGNYSANGVEVDIPNTVNPRTNVSIYSVPASQQPLPPATTAGQSPAYVAVSPVYDVRSAAATNPAQPDGGAFSGQVSVTIQYPSTLTNLNLTDIWYYDTSQNPPQWVNALKSPNTTTRTFQLSNNQETYYALFQPVQPSVPTSP